MFVFKRTVFLQLLLFYFIGTRQTKSVFGFQLPDIYSFISNNAYICSTVELSDGSRIMFLGEQSGKICTECKKASYNYACGTKTFNNETGHVACYRVPPLCIDAFELQYGGIMDKGVLVAKSRKNENDKKIREKSLDISTEFDVALIVENVTCIDCATNSTGNTIKLKTDTKIMPDRIHNRFKRVRLNKQFPFIGTTLTTLLPSTTMLPCEDKNSICCFWATSGECDNNPFWMRVNCAKTCGTCHCSLANADQCLSTGVNCILPTSTSRLTTTAPTTITKPFTSPKTSFPVSTITTTTTESAKTDISVTTNFPTSTLARCKDNHKECGFWAMLGECRVNPFYMRPNCQSSCGSCNEKVDSVYAPTPRPAKQLASEIPPVTGCDNGHVLCNYWAHIGECFSNSNYMLPTCRLACRVC